MHSQIDTQQPWLVNFGSERSESYNLMASDQLDHEGVLPLSNNQVLFTGQDGFPNANESLDRHSFMPIAIKLGHSGLWCSSRIRQQEVERSR